MWGGIMINLPRDTIETTVVCLGDKVEKYKDPQWEYVRSGAEKFIDLRSFNFTERRNMLASQQFDVLVYVDSVMDTAVYFLGLARLAPIQCATWGLQMTSGSPEMDFFISLGSELPNAQEYYTETLIRFQTPGVFFHPPRVPSKPLGRQDFGLPQHKTLYVCPHNLRKVQYAYLAVVQGILERDSEAVVVFIAVLGEAWITTLLQRTLQRRLPAQLLPRIYILPTKSTYGRYDLKEDLYDLMMIADVLLDTFPFGGCTISHEALYTDIPIVTLSSTPLLAGRCTMFLLQYINVPECIANSVTEYINIAVEFGTNVQWRHAVKEKISTNKKRLYNNSAAVLEWARFIQFAHNSARSLGNRARAV